MINLVWWYYNKHYSETGCVSQNLNDIFDRLKKDGYHSKKIKSEIIKSGSYEDFHIDIHSVKFYGDLQTTDLNKDTLYILRYPEGIYTDCEKAYKVGVMHVINDKNSFDKGDTYIWGSKDWNNKTRTKCDDEWFLKVGGATLKNPEKMNTH